MTANVVYLNDDDRRLILETKQKLEEATKLMDDLLETVEILSDPDMMRSIREGLDDIRAGRVIELSKLLKEEAH
jgi:PHD/YefM family antitoxin component YafN of YafNO toxin-antitoxin module